MMMQTASTPPMISASLSPTSSFSSISSLQSRSMSLRSSSMKNSSFIVIEMPINEDKINWAQENRLPESPPVDDMDDDIRSMYGLHRLSISLAMGASTSCDMDDDIRSTSGIHRRSYCVGDSPQTNKIDRKTSSSHRRHSTGNTERNKAIQRLSYSSSLQRLPRSGASKTQAPVNVLP